MVPVDTQARLLAAMARAWRRQRATVLGRVVHLERALEALRAGDLTPALREEAAMQAHQLAGTLGTFGQEVASALAHRLERLLKPGLGQSADTVENEMSHLLRDLKRELRERDTPEVRVEESIDEASPILLVVDPDSAVVNELKAEAATRGIRVRAASSPRDARRELEAGPPDIAVLDLDGSDESFDLLRDLASGDRPVLVLTDRDTLTDRVEVARLGGSGFLQKPLPASQVVDEVIDHLARRRSARGRIMLVDDDPAIADAVRTLLNPEGLQVRTLDDPRRFWEVLEDYAPDLLILDHEMPFLNGLELCQVVRNDPRWSALPVVFLGGTSESEAVNQVFDAGADDLIHKSTLNTRLVHQVRNRLERTRLFTRLAETDPLTGLANRRKSAQEISRLMSLAERNEQPLSVALVDLDGFKAINDTHGHAAGDRVLRRLGTLLLASFRGEDVVSRWGGEEMVVAMYGMNREDGVHRLAEVLETFNAFEFEGRGGTAFSVSFSAGVAQFPENGTDLHALYRAADDAMYLAKQQGRSRILPAGWTPPQNRHDQCDAAIVSRDPSMADLVRQAMGARGYTPAHFSNLSDSLDTVAEIPPRALLIDVGPGDEAALERLERLLQEGQYEASRVVLLVPENRTLEGPLPDSPGVRLLGRNFQVFELMRTLRTIWKQ